MVWAVGASNLGKAPVVVPGPGPGTVGMPGATARGAGVVGAAGIGTNRWAPAWGASPVTGVATGAWPAAGAFPVAAGAVALLPAAAGAAVAAGAGAVPA